ncbi:MAG: glycosyltransferase [Deltaproteobacteria bacterium]|nr:glycosyltransferase [Deltaproteobacteria bacterium]
MDRNKINIFHLRDSPWLDGPGRTILETASAIDSSRFNYLLGAFVRNGTTEHPFIDAASKRKANIFKISESGTFDFRTVSQILEIMEKEEIDILHTHEVRSDILGLICAKIKRIPVVTTLHGWIKNSMKDSFLVFCDKNILRFFDHVIAVSTMIKTDVLKHGVSTKNITVLYNSLIIDRYKPNINDNSFREELGIGKETLLVGNIGRLSPEKGQYDFIMAAEQVLKRYDNIKFLIIGSGPERDSLERLVCSKGMHDWIIFTGYRNDMLRIYNSLDLVVQSSHTEGMPNVILEAMLMEVPVIATNVGGTSEAVKDDITGVLVEPHNPEVLGEQIIKFITEQERFKDYSKRGRKTIMENFDFCVRTKKLERVYENLIGIKNK